MVQGESVKLKERKHILFYIDMVDLTGAQRVMSLLVNYFASLDYAVTFVNDFDNSTKAPGYNIDGRVNRVYLDDIESGNPIKKNIHRIRRLRSILKSEKPDLAVSFLGHPNYRLMIAKFGTKVKTIVSVRSDPNREYGNRWWQKKIANGLLNRAEGVVFQTSEAANYFGKSINRKAIILLNPVDGKFYEVERAVNVENIISAGRLEPVKNHKLLIDAFGLIHERFPQEKLIIYGTGYLHDDLKEYISSLNLVDSVILFGNTENMPGELAKAKVFVLSSDFEGMPNALMEAMAAGVPTVATDCPCGGPRTLIRNGESGLLVEKGNAQAMADAISSIISSGALQDKLSAESKKAAGSFRDREVFDSWRKYFESII